MTANARTVFEEALALEQSGNLDKALVSYLKAQELSPQDSEIAYKTASALLQAGYLEEAQSQLRRIVFAEPDNLNARASLGNCQLLLGDSENALQNFKDVLAHVPENRNALYGLASVYLKAGKPVDAVAPAKQLINLLPDSPAVLSLFAQTQAKTGQSAASIAAYRKALKTDPSHFESLLGLADVLQLRKRYDEVIELTIRANEVAPADPLPLEILSDALAGKGALDDAYEAGEAALKLQPDSQSVLVRLSVLARKRGDLIQALKYSLDAHILDTRAADPLNAIGAALAALKFPEEARGVLTGIAAGKALDDKTRKLAEGLIAEHQIKVMRSLEVASDATAAASESEGLGQREAGLSGNEEHSVSRSETNDTSEPRTELQKPVPKPLSPKEAQPNVLGLQRRDRT